MEKPCLECGASIVKKIHESKARFGKRSFCSTSCSYKYMREHHMGWWNKDNDNPTEAA